MTKFNFTNKQIERAQEVAKLMVTLNHIGNGFLGESVEDVEKFISVVNGIEEEKEVSNIHIDMETDAYDLGTINLAETLTKYIEEIQKFAKYY